MTFMCRNDLSKLYNSPKTLNNTFENEMTSLHLSISKSFCFGFREKSYAILKKTADTLCRMKC